MSDLERSTKRRVPTSDQQARMHISRKDFTYVWGEHDLSVIPEIYSPTFRGHGFPVKRTVSRSQYRWLAYIFQQAFPDCHIKMLEMTADDEYVYTKWVFRGTHAGSVAKIPPTGESIEFTGKGYHRHENRRVKEVWLLVDWSKLYRALLSGYNPL